MALSRQKKEETVSQVVQLLSDSKLTVFAQYQGTSVKALQDLRTQSRSSGTVVKVIKNRLFKKALNNIEGLKDINFPELKGQILYAFNSEDEVASAQNLAAFAKNNPQIEFVGGLSADGGLLDADEVKILASLQTKDQLRAQLIMLVNSPLQGFVSVISGNARGLLNVLSARADSVS